MLEYGAFYGVGNATNPSNRIAPNPITPEALLYNLKAKLKIPLGHFHRQRARLKSAGIVGRALHADEADERSKAFGQHRRIFQSGICRFREVVSYD